MVRLRGALSLDIPMIGLVLAERAFRTRDKNPYQYLLYSNMMRLGPKVREFLEPRNWLERAPDIVHLHWPEMPLGHPSQDQARAQIQFLIKGLLVCKARGAKVIWTVHNLESHEGGARNDAFRNHLRIRLWKAVRALLDGWIAHSEDSAASARIAHPWLERLPSAIIPHGHFRDEYPHGIARTEARTRLGISPTERVMLCFGAVRRYRNVPALLDAFRAMPGDDFRLIIAGSVQEGVLKDKIERLADRDTRVRLDLRHVPVEEVQCHFGASDLVVLPYRDILNSGAALLALSFDRPVLLPDMGSMPELRRSIGANWVRLFKEQISAFELEESMNWARTTTRPVQAPLSGLDWPCLAKRTLEFYQQVRAA